MGQDSQPAASGLKPISQATDNSTDWTSNQSSPLTSANRDRAAKFYGFLVREFGPDKVASVYGETVSDDLVVFLADFTDAQLRQGLQAMRNEGDEWPPNVAKFRRWCTKAEPPKPQYFPKALPPPQAEVDRKKLVNVIGARVFGEVAEGKLPPGYQPYEDDPNDSPSLRVAKKQAHARNMGAVVQAYIEAEVARELAA